MRAFMQRRMAQWIRRRQGEDVFPVTLQRRRLYILPTRTGMAFGVLLLLMLVAGLNYANSLALLTTFLLAGLALVSMQACHRNLLGLTVTDLSAQDSFAGGEAEVRLRLLNSDGRLRVGIELEGAAGPAVACSVAANGTIAAHLKIATPLRGVMPLGRLRIRTTWPFGLFRGWTWLHVADEVTVYPRPHGSRPMPVAAGARGGTAPHAAGELDEWATLRGFREGDSPRQVAWKAYARGAPLLVKEYTASGSAERLFDFAVLAGLDTEQRLSQLAQWIVSSAAEGERFGLRLPRQFIDLDQGPGHRQRCLRALARYGLAERAGG
jgi:uncharacterized protein (DUF58 family)